MHMINNNFEEQQIMFSRQSPKNNYQSNNLPISPNKQTYKQYMDPNFIEPINLNQNLSISVLYQWQQSTRQM